MLFWRKEWTQLLSRFHFQTILLFRPSAAALIRLNWPHYVHTCSVGRHLVAAFMKYLPCKWSRVTLTLVFRKHRRLQDMCFRGHVEQRHWIIVNGLLEAYRFNSNVYPPPTSPPPPHLYCCFHTSCLPVWSLTACRDEGLSSDLLQPSLIIVTIAQSAALRLVSDSSWKHF